MISVSPESSSVISRQGVLQPCPIAAGIVHGTEPAHAPESQFHVIGHHASWRCDGFRGPLGPLSAAGLRRPQARAVLASPHDHVTHRMGAGLRARRAGRGHPAAAAARAASPSPWSR